MSATPLHFNDAGLPVCGRFGEPYLRSRDAGRAAHDFLSDTCVQSAAAVNGNTVTTHTVLEIGFGLGVNFLAAVAAHRQAGARRLNYVAFECEPVQRDELVRAWNACNAQRGHESIADALLRQWPPLIRGAHRISLAGGVTLTLIFDDASDTLRDWHCLADTLILDAYSPSVNPAVWTDAFFRLLVARCKPGATLVSPDHDAAARDKLARVGFTSIQRRSPQWICATYQPRFETNRLPGTEPARDWSNQTAIVVGAGLAGIQCARELAATGWHVSIVDRQCSPTGAPQQQPVIAAHPHFSPDDNPLARLTRAAFLLSRSDQQTLEPVGRLMLTGEKQLDGLTAALGECPESFAQTVSAEQASDIAGTSLTSDALWLPEMTIRVSGDQPAPRALAKSIGLQWLPAAQVANIERRDDGLWYCIDDGGASVGCASVIVLATGHPPNVLQTDSWPGVVMHNGQTTSIQTELTELQCVVGGSSYACPLPCKNQILAGATSVDAMDDQALVQNDQRNLSRLTELIGRDSGEMSVINRHLGVRCTTRDHLPMIGAMPDMPAIAASAKQLGANDRLPLPSHPGVYLASGFGGRGLLWSYLAARCITDHVNNQIGVLPSSLEQAIAPNRFVRRALRQGQF